MRVNVHLHYLRISPFHLSFSKTTRDATYQTNYWHGTKIGHAEFWKDNHRMTSFAKTYHYDNDICNEY